MTMLELRHSPWCEGLTCVDSVDPSEEIQAGQGGLEEDPLMDPETPEDTSISSSLQLVLPSDFGPTRLSSESYCNVLCSSCTASN